MSTTETVTVTLTRRERMILVNILERYRWEHDHANPTAQRVETKLRHAQLDEVTA